jgi:hypothetical protein
MNPPCTHGRACDHKNANGQYRCTACGRCGTWSSQWRVPKHRKCEACGAVPMNVVACSAECAGFLIAERRWK